MSSRTAKGTPSVQLLPIPREEKITSLVAVDSFVDDRYLLMLTKAGFIKRTALSAFSKIRSNGLIAINLEDGDALTWVRLSKEGDSVLIGSKTGMAIHFRLDVNELRPLGRTARGVKSMNLREGDNLVSMDVLTSNLVDQLAEFEDIDREIDDKFEENSFHRSLRYFDENQNINQDALEWIDSITYECLNNPCLLYTSPSPRD